MENRVVEILEHWQNIRTELIKKHSDEYSTYGKLAIKDMFNENLRCAVDLVEKFDLNSSYTKEPKWQNEV